MGLEEEDRSEEPCLSLKVFFFKYLHLFLCYINGIGFYLFMAVLGLHCCAGFSLVVVSGGATLIAVASLGVEHRL